MEVNDPRTYRPAPSEIPTSPGVYRFLDKSGTVIYVGKANNLRNRIQNYFGNPAGMHPRTWQMVSTAKEVTWTVVNSELEALTLEYTWIKEFNPKFNVIFRDDKSYPYIALSVSEKFPRAYATRSIHRKGTRYFGPYTQKGSVRETIKHLLSYFPVRPCANSQFLEYQQRGKPCLLGHINKCCAPCVQAVSKEEYEKLVKDLINFLSGRDDDLIQRLEIEMRQAAMDLEFEKAAKLRDAKQALEMVLAKNTVVFENPVDLDVISWKFDELEISIQVFFVRAGRIRGSRTWTSERWVEQDEAEIAEDILEHLYGNYSASEPYVNFSQKKQKLTPKSVDDRSHFGTEVIPPEVLLPVIPRNVEIMQNWLSKRWGRKVTIKVPKRSARKDLIEMATENAKQALMAHRLRRVGDVMWRSAALNDLQQIIDLNTGLLRLECYDISHIAGSNRVASMVVFQDALAQKSQYRSFKIRGTDFANQDDTAAMQEVLSRRFTKYLQGSKDPSFSQLPDLLVVDGGIPQVNSASLVLETMGINIPVIGLAKRLEEIWIPHDEIPLILPRGCQGIFLLQQLRDESHRFAITAHRKLRTKVMTKSVIDDIPGLGPKRQKILLRKFGSLKRIRQATVEEITKVEGIGKKRAEHLHQAIRMLD